MLACINANITIVRMLIDSCKSTDELVVLLNKGNQQSFTPLHAVCLAGNTELCDVLLQAGADLFKLDNKRF